MAKQDNIKAAFLKVKQDMTSLNKRISSIEEGSTTKVPSVKELQESISTTFEEVEELLQEKQEIQFSSFKLEVEEKLLALKEETPQSSQVQQEIQREISELSELLQEKISMEVSSLRLEITEEIAKIYDRCFDELLSLKGEINTLKQASKLPQEPQTKFKKTKTTKKSPTKKEETKSVSPKVEEVVLNEQTLEDEKKEGKLKRLAKWLFVDEVEEEIKDIKSEVKKK